MTRRLVSGVVVGALVAAFAGSVAAQPKPAPGQAFRPGAAACDPKNCAYWLSATAGPTNNVVKSGVYNGAVGVAGGLCYRTGYWSPAMAIGNTEDERLLGLSIHSVRIDPPAT